jgi:predicted dehydrogenase
MPVDLHIHDTDFILNLLDRPEGVTARRAGGEPGGVDVLRTAYGYPEAVVESYSAWVHPGFGFAAWFSAVFERATVSWHSARAGELVLVEGDKRDRPTALPAVDGYRAELEEFVRCVRDGSTPPTAPPESSLESLRLVLLEMESARTGRPLALDA